MSFIKLFTFIACFVSMTLLAQGTTISFDYKVTYEVPSEKRQTVDVFEVLLSKDGRYLLTNSKQLGLTFAASMFQNPNQDYSNASSILMLDSKTLDLFLNFELEGNSVYLKLNLDQFIPVDEEDAISEDMVLVSEKLDKNINIQEEQYDAYLLYPEGEPLEGMTIGIDPNRPYNGNTILNEFFKLMVRKTNSEGSLTMDLPDGLIVYMGDGDKTMIKAKKLEDITTTLTIQHTFNLRE